MIGRFVHDKDRSRLCQCTRQQDTLLFEPGTQDRYSSYVLNTILGGSFSSRINMNLRERNGYTYGASSRLTYLRNGGWFSAGSGVRTDVTAPGTSATGRAPLRSESAAHEMKCRMTLCTWWLFWSPRNSTS